MKNKNNCRYLIGCVIDRKVLFVLKFCCSRISAVEIFLVGDCIEKESIYNNDMCVKFVFCFFPVRIG